MTFVGYIVYHLHPRSARAQMILLGPQINYIPSKSHVIVLSTMKYNNSITIVIIVIIIIIIINIIIIIVIIIIIIIIIVILCDNMTEHINDRNNR